MKKETVEDELKFMKMDFMTMQKNLHSENSAMARIIDDMREHIAYLYSKMELKVPERKVCMECDGRGTFYISPISDCGQSNKCKSCHGMGFKYV